jgi:hypothetical protein
MDRDAQYFQSCRAKRGFGARRLEFIKELRVREHVRTHYIIMTVALSTGAAEPSPEVLAKKAENLTVLNSIIEELNAIVTHR